MYAPPELIDQTDYALNIATVVLDYYESYYGIKYPLHKSGEISPARYLFNAFQRKRGFPIPVCSLFRLHTQH